MGWLDQLQEKIIGLDTAPLIYFIEQNVNYIETVRPFFRAINQGEFQVVTSILTLTEVLVYPLRINNTELAQQYREILSDQDYLKTVDISSVIAEIAAYLRGKYNIRTPDAIQLATAINQSAVYFLTNDARLPNLLEIEILLLDDLNKYD
jgi:predicted nucleic acid-binding protein